MENQIGTGGGFNWEERAARGGKERGAMADARCLEFAPGGLRGSGFSTSPAPTKTYGGCEGKSSITFVMDFGGAESYRFFFEVGTDFVHELRLLSTFDRSWVSASGFERDCDGCGAGDVVERRVGGWSGVAGASRQRLLLPLRDVEGTRRVREDVRDAEVCVALVGDFLRAAEEQGFEGCDEGRAAVSASGASGAGFGDGATVGRFAVGQSPTKWHLAAEAFRGR